MYPNGGINTKKKTKSRKQQMLEQQRMQSQMMATMQMFSPYANGAAPAGFGVSPFPNPMFYPNAAFDYNQQQQQQYHQQQSPPQAMYRKQPSAGQNKANNSNAGGGKKSNHDVLMDNLHVKPKTNPIETWAIPESTGQLEAPGPDKIRNIHIYDFDNTLFRTPLPNPELLSTSAIGVLESLNGLHGGGWWADSRFLLGTGNGYEEEKKVAWKGWWNERVVELAKMSWEDPDSLCILLSGRKSASFADCISSVVEAKGLKFNALILRREDKSGAGESTLQFKNKIIVDLLKYYDQANSITIYEDRPKQANGFRRTLKHLSSVIRPELIYEVVEVYEPQTYLDPVVERDLIEDALKAHNEASSKGLLHKNTRNARVELVSDVVYSGYILDKINTRDLLKLLYDSELIEPPNVPPTSNAVKFDGEAIVTNSKGKLPSNMANDLGKRVSWKVTHIGQHDSKIWAVQVAPVDENQQVITERKIPVIILAIKRKTNPNEVVQISEWTPLPNPITINSTVGEKTILKMNTFPRAKNNTKN